jgi:Hemingway/CFA97
MWNKIACNSHYEDFLKNKEAKRFIKSLYDIKPIVNTSGPKKVLHLKKRSKKIQLRENRAEEISYSNQKLMEKMMSIESRAFYVGDSSGSFSKSLNKSYRSKTNMNINQENLRILDRLQSAQPVLSLEKWEKGEKNWKKLREHIAKCKKGSRGPLSLQESESNYLINQILKRKKSRPATTSVPE